MREDMMRLLELDMVNTNIVRKKQTKKCMV